MVNVVLTFISSLKKFFENEKHIKGRHYVRTNACGAKMTLQAPLKINVGCTTLNLLLPGTQHATPSVLAVSWSLGKNI